MPRLYHGGSSTAWSPPLGLGSAVDSPNARERDIKHAQDKHRFDNCEIECTRDDSNRNHQVESIF
jgi:hypothetical protein